MGLGPQVQVLAPAGDAEDCVLAKALCSQSFWWEVPMPMAPGACKWDESLMTP